MWSTSKMGLPTSRFYRHRDNWCGHWRRGGCNPWKELLSYYCHSKSFFGLLTDIVALTHTQGYSSGLEAGIGRIRLPFGRGAIPGVLPRREQLDQGIRLEFKCWRVVVSNEDIGKAKAGSPIAVVSTPGSSVFDRVNGSKFCPSGT